MTGPADHGQAAYDRLTAAFHAEPTFGHGAVDRAGECGHCREIVAALSADARPAPQHAQCCCRWGAAISRKRGSGEWPEDPCRDCAVHGEDGDPHRCRRHKTAAATKEKTA